MLRLSVFCVLSLCFVLSGCGQKGALYLPQEPASEQSDSKPSSEI